MSCFSILSSKVMLNIIKRYLSFFLFCKRKWIQMENSIKFLYLKWIRDRNITLTKNDFLTERYGIKKELIKVHILEIETHILEIVLLTAFTCWKTNLIWKFNELNFVIFFSEKANIIDVSGKDILSFNDFFNRTLIEEWNKIKCRILNVCFHKC